MNPVETYDALVELAGKPYDPIGFPLDFALATDNAPATIAKCRGRTSNKSDPVKGSLRSDGFQFVRAITWMSVAITTHKSGDKFGFLPSSPERALPGQRKNPVNVSANLANFGKTQKQRWQDTDCENGLA
jgi:hypothetical protein